MAQGYKCVTVNTTAYVFDPQSKKKYIFISSYLYAMLQGFGGNWRMECLNPRFPSAYPVVCGMQHDADSNIILKLVSTKKILKCNPDFNIFFVLMFLPKLYCNKENLEYQDHVLFSFFINDVRCREIVYRVAELNTTVIEENEINYFPTNTNRTYEHHPYNTQNTTHRDTATHMHLSQF